MDLGLRSRLESDFLDDIENPFPNSPQIDTHHGSIPDDQSIQNTPIAAAAATCAKKRVSTACEACRLTKIRCQPSHVAGICKKCLQSRRECVSRTGPRTRRSKKTRTGSSKIDSERSPPPGPTSTFSIDFDFIPQPENDDSFELLREAHAGFMDKILPPLSANESSFSFDHGLATPLSSSTFSLPLSKLQTKPKFNLLSAESFLEAFKTMLPHFPCISLSPTATVKGLAATKPFLLLAILASAAASRSLQGHSLYDEEFRKVLGLKFVAGGERSLELLQGILVYCAWFPFHLRPKNKQVHQYMRMTGDLIKDLELDQIFIRTLDVPSEHQLDGVRAYVGCYYMLSSFTFRAPRYEDYSEPFTHWTSTCCDLLGRSVNHNDQVLAYLVRLGSIICDAAKAVQGQDHEPEQRISLIRLGLDTKLRTLVDSMPHSISVATPVKFTFAFAQIYLPISPIIRFPRRSHSVQTSSSLLPSSSALANAICQLKVLFGLFEALPDSAYAAFTSVEWSRFIVAVILGVRLSFPLAECLEWDHAWARRELDFGKVLSALCEKQETELTPQTSGKVDILSASRVVLKAVKEKYDKRVRIMQDSVEQRVGETSIGCPMLDGSMNQWLSEWDIDLSASVPRVNMMGGDSSSVASSNREQGDQQQLFQDLWATMTGSWTGEDEAARQDIM